jgi:hypothetical protein
MSGDAALSLFRSGADPQFYGVKNLPVSRSPSTTVEWEGSRAIRGGAALTSAPAKDASTGFAKGSIAASGFINEDE